MSRSRTHPTIAGFPRETRRAGIRDHLLIMPSVICSALVSEAIADAVPGAIAVPHDHGCAQIGGDKDQTRRTLLHVAANPNVAGVVLVGLGCETLNSEELAADVDVPVRQTSIQGTGSTDATIAAGIEAAEELSAGSAPSRSAVGIEELTVGIVASDAASTTVNHVYPMLGGLVDRLVAAGGRVVVGGLDPFVPHRSAIVDLVGDTATATELDAMLEARTTNGIPTRVHRDAADLSLADLGTMFGNKPIAGAYTYGSIACHDTGVAVVDTSAAFEEAATGLVAAGAQLIVHATAAGIPTGHPVAPVISMTGDASTAAAMGEDVDVDATATDEATLYDRVIRVASGEATAAERHGLSPFAITRTGPSL